MASLGTAVLGWTPPSIPLVGDLTPGAGMRMDVGVVIVNPTGSGTPGPTVPTSGITWPRTR